jgi:hypothetical protein
MLIPQAAWLSAAMLLLHSLVDYPLRTAALAALFASAIGLLFHRGDTDQRLHA